MFFKSEISKFFTFSDAPLSEISEEYINNQLQISVIQTSSVNKFNPTGIVNQALTLWYHATDIQHVICLKDYSLRAKIIQDIKDFLNKNFDSFITNPTLCQALAESVYSCARAKRIYNQALKKAKHLSYSDK